MNLRHPLLCAALALGAHLGWSQAFGRFGYTEKVAVPSFEVTREGFQIKSPLADGFRFETASTWWRPLATSEYQQVVGLSGVGRSPSKVRFDLFEPGFALYFGTGVGLHTASTAAPYLSWAEGSVGPGVPTPKVSWLMLSFRNAQPPVVLAFLGPPAAVTLTGRSGDWTLRTDSLYQGWVRVVAPFGVRGYSTNTAAELGRLVKRVVAEAAVWTAPAPRLLDVRVTEEPTAVTAVWTFDRPGALVPTPITLAPLGGYPLKLQSKTRRIGADEEGPLVIGEESALVVRMPVRRVPTGRGVGVGGRASDAIGTVSPIDLPSVVEIALQNLCGTRDSLARQAGEDVLGAFLSDARYEVEPYTNQRLPFAAGGEGMDLVAAHALLMQARDTAERASSVGNALLTSLAWRRDWYTWRLWCPDPVLARRAGALAAVSGAICPEAARRLDAAMFEAGLAAERGLPIWRRRVLGGPDTRTPLIEPLDALRSDLFLRTGAGAAATEYVRLLQSDVRVFGEVGVTTELDGNVVVLAWHAEAGQRVQLILASAYPLAVSPGGNVKDLRFDEALGFTTLKGVAEADGKCTVRLTPPTWASALPAMPGLPRYSEPLR